LFTHFMDTNFLAETTLKKLSPVLHQRYSHCIATADQLLGLYLNNFPEFTDHSVLHSVEVTSLGNFLISNNIKNLSAEEIYILLMSILLHDVGMGYSVEKLKQTDFPAQYPGQDPVQIIRKYHHDLSALFIMENWENCFIPNEEMAYAIAEVSRGHRKTDLMDLTLYPVKPYNLAYLAAILRLADEIDVSAARNLILQFVGFIPSNNRDAIEFNKHRSLRSEIEGDKFILIAEVKIRQEFEELKELCAKITDTLEYCRMVALERANIDLPIRTVVDNLIYTGDSTPLKMEADRSGDLLTIILTGKLDNTTAPPLDENLASHLGGTIINLLIDIGGLKYISSAGLRVILSAKKRTLKLGGSMVLKNVPEEIMDIFRTTGFDTFFEFV